MWRTLLVFIVLQAGTPGPNNLTCLYLGANFGLKGVMRYLPASMILFFIKLLLCGFLSRFCILAKRLDAKRCQKPQKS